MQLSDVLSIKKHTVHCQYEVSVIKSYHMIIVPNCFSDTKYTIIPSCSLVYITSKDNATRRAMLTNLKDWRDTFGSDFRYKVSYEFTDNQEVEKL